MPISPYLARLRKSVGNDLILVPGVAVLVGDGAGRLLLVRQSDTGLWATLGGAIDPEEHPEVAGIREAFEETSLRVKITSLVGVCGGPGHTITYPNGDRASYVSVVYRADVVSGTPEPDNDEVTEVAWVLEDKLAAVDLHPFTKTLFTDLGLIP